MCTYLDLHFIFPGQRNYLYTIMSAHPRVIIGNTHFKLTINRLCYQLIENHDDFKNTCIIGVQPRGIYLSDRIVKRLKAINPALEIEYGKLDVTFYRDDFRQKGKPLTPTDTTINFSVEDKKVVLVDDVLYTGRTIRSAMDAILDYGRPSKIELLALVDRRFSRHVPVQPDYTGKTVDAIVSEKVQVEWEEVNGSDKIWILSANDEMK